MNRTASFELQPNHPLSGLEGWPKTGPVYGLADDEATSRGSTFWERLGDRFRKSPEGDNRAIGQARIWY